MTTEDQDAVLGRLVREKKEAEKNLAMLKAEARAFGVFMYVVGGQLKNDPGSVVFDQQSFSGVNPGQIFERKKMPTLEKLLALTEDIRSTEREIERLAESLKPFMQ